MAINKKAIATIIIAITLAITGVTAAVISSGLLVAQQSVQTNGSVNGQVSSSMNIGVYSNAAATVNCSSISWGSLSPGGTTTQTIYIKNTGSQNETLSLSSSNWTPSTASSFLTLTWNMQGDVLPAGATIPALLTLTAASNTGTLTSFSFDVVVSGSA